MSYQVQVGTQVITLPSTGADAVWSGGQIQFNKAVAAALNGIVSPFDTPPTVITIDNTGVTNLKLEDIQSGDVRSYIMTYGIYRENSVQTLYEQGTLRGVYNDDTSTWILNQNFSGPRRVSVGNEGTQYHTFSMSGDELRLNAVPLSVGVGGGGTISFSIKTELVNP